MKKKTFVGSLLVLCLAACNSQDSRYLHPCQGKYGTAEVIRNIKQQHNLKDANIVFNEWYKEPARLPNNCDTIHLYIEARNAPLLLEDTFAISVGHFFFSDSANSVVKYLYLEAKETWPMVGRCTTKYLLSKESLDTYKYELTMSSDSSENQQYEIIQETSRTGSGIKGLNVVAKVTKDIKNPQKLANLIKDRYINTIKDRELNQFSVEMRVDSPFCKLCKSKTYSVFFDKRNKNL